MTTSSPVRRSAREPSEVVVELRYDGDWVRRREFRSVGEARAFLARS